MYSHRERFIKWYVRPFNRLKRIKYGDGAFIILSMGLFLCERYYRIKSNSIKARKLGEKFHKCAAKDFDCSPALFRQFWFIYRHGMQHQGQPQKWFWEYLPGGVKKKRRFKWLIDDMFEYRPTKWKKDGHTIICLNPDEFTRFVLGKYLKNPKILKRSIVHAFGDIS